MRITQAIRQAGSEQEVFLLLTAYAKATRLGGDPVDEPMQPVRLPLTSRDDVQRQMEALPIESSMASGELDGTGRMVMMEARYVFGEALLRLEWLDATRRSGGATAIEPG
jgi:hypothetical protein